MGHIIRKYIPEEPATFTDWVDDDGLGNGPFKMVLTIWREGDVCHADWTGTDDQAPGSINFHIHEGLCKLFLGIYMIMAFDPEILFNDGIYDVFEVTLPGGIAPEPEVPGAAVEPAERPHAALRLHERRARPEGARALDGGRARDKPVLRLLGLATGLGEYFQFVELLFGGLPGAVLGRRARRALVVAALPHDARRVRRELLPGAHLELRPGARHRRRGLPSRRHRDREDVRVSRARRVHGERRPRHDPPSGINGGRHGGCSTKKLIRASGEVVELPSKIDQVQVNGETRSSSALRAPAAGATRSSATPRWCCGTCCATSSRPRQRGGVRRRDHGRRVRRHRHRCRARAPREQRGAIEPFDFGHAPTGGDA